MNQNLQITLRVTAPVPTVDNVHLPTGVIDPAMHLTQAFADDLSQYLNAQVTQIEVSDLSPCGIVAGHMEAAEGEDLRDRFREKPAESAQIVEVGTFVWICVYEHKHGMNTWAFTSEAAAAQHRQFIAESWWAEEMPEGTEKPEDPDEMADAYFDEMGAHGEFYTIHRTLLEA